MEILFNIFSSQTPHHPPNEFILINSHKLDYLLYAAAQFPISLAYFAAWSFR